VAALRLHPRDDMAGTTQFKLLPPVGVLTSLKSEYTPPPAPNKLEINDTMELKLFTAKDIPGLSRLTNIQRWYNALHSKGRVCGVYTTPWEHFSKTNIMGVTWDVRSVSQEVMHRQDLMSAALHSLLSSVGLFKADCEDFSHLVSNSNRNGYEALYQIVRLVHPVLGQTTAQPAQPMQKKTQSFAEHVVNYIDYFQSELCSGRHYSPNEQLIFIVSRLHPVWRDVLKRKYTQLVPQNGTATDIPMECQIPMLSVTLTQWCEEEGLWPSARPGATAPRIFSLQDTADTINGLAGLSIDMTPSPLHLGHTMVDSTVVDTAVEHIICYVAAGASKSTFPKCAACGLPGHRQDQCHPLVNFCLAQALAERHPELVKRIKAAYKLFPRSSRTRAPATSSGSTITGGEVTLIHYLFFITKHKTTHYICMIYIFIILVQHVILVFLATTQACNITFSVLHH
jgi:hypothetical protein